MLRLSRLRLLSLAGLFAWTVACAASPVPGPAQTPAVDTALRSLPSQASIFLWRATRPDRPGVVWLLGSVHVRKAEQAVLDAALLRAARDSGVAAFESDLEQLDAQAVVAFVTERGRLPPGQTLADLMEPARFARLTSMVSEVGMSMASLQGMQPWMATITLQGWQLKQLGFTAESGVDHMVDAFARQEPSRQRTIVALEDPIETIRMFSDSPGEVQLAMLEATLQGMLKGEMEALLAVYMKGDERGLVQLLDEARAQDTSLEPFFALILDRRNEGMLAKILPMFEREGESIVTVGAAHLHGARGLLPMLTDLGAEIDIVNPEGPASPTMLALARRRPPVLTSQEDAFQVDLGARSVRQQLPIPGSEQSMRLHVTSLGPGTQLLVTVVPTDAASDAGRRAALDRAMERGMRAAGLQSGTPEQVTLGGRPASRVSGESDTAGAVCVGAVHDGRVYTLLGLFSGSDPAQHQKMRAQFERAQRSFRFLQAPERRARPTGARSPVDVPPVGP